MSVTELHIKHTNRLYLPHKYVRVAGEGLLVNPELENHEYWAELSDHERAEIFNMWASHDEEGAIMENPAGADIMSCLQNGLLSTIKGM